MKSTTSPTPHPFPIAATLAGLLLLTLPLVGMSEDMPKPRKNVITSVPCKPGTPDCPIPTCPPDCLMEIGLSLTDASGNTQSSRGDVKATQRQIAQFIEKSGLSPQEKADARKTMQNMLAAATRGDPAAAKKKPEVTINCQGGPTTSPTGGTGGTVTCGFTVKFGGGK